jgi:putative hydrolase of the HAD superfamily
MDAVAAWVEDELSLPKNRSFAELCRLFENGARGDTFDRWLADYGLASTDRIEGMVRIYRNHNPQIAPYPGARDLLRRLRRGYSLGLVTDGRHDVQQRKMAALGLAEHFQAIVYSDELGRNAWKPSPRPFEEVLRRLSVTGQEAIYVADNPKKDFRGARRVGMGTVRIRHPDGLYCRLEPARPDDAPDMEVAGLGSLTSLLTGVTRGSVKGLQN